MRPRRPQIFFSFHTLYPWINKGELHDFTYLLLIRRKIVMNIRKREVKSDQQYAQYVPVCRLPLAMYFSVQISDWYLAAILIPYTFILENMCTLVSAVRVMASPWPTKSHAETTSGMMSRALVGAVLSSPCFAPQHNYLSSVC